MRVTVNTTQNKREHMYVLAPVTNSRDGTAIELLSDLLSRQWFAFSHTNPMVDTLASGDLICFYAKGSGIVARAEVASAPERVRIPGATYPDKFDWAFRLRGIKTFFQTPVSLSVELRSSLEGLRGTPSDYWGWFVRAPRIVSKHDFDLLTSVRPK